MIPATVRDATYVLDAILDNETELAVLEHATDTAGYTELVFALFDLLGLQLAPRLRDIGDQQLYRLTRDQRAATWPPRQSDDPAGAHPTLWGWPAPAGRVAQAWLGDRVALHQ